MFHITQKEPPTGTTFSDEHAVLKISMQYPEASSELNKVIWSLFRRSKVIAKSDIVSHFYGHTRVLSTLLLADVDLGYLIKIEQKGSDPEDEYYVKGPKFLE